MAYWLCYTTCLTCTGQCSACQHRDQSISVHVVQSEQQPAHAVNGPCDTPDELLSTMAKHFVFGPDGLLRLKDLP
jgi:hypothetical protein